MGDTPNTGMVERSPDGTVDPMNPSVNPDITAFIVEKYKDTKEAYTSYHQMAWEAILMQAGQTWIRWDAARKVFEPDAPADDWTPLPRINRFAPTVDSIVSNFQRVPEIEAVTKGGNDDPFAWAIADIATKLAEDFAEVNGIRSDYNNLSNEEDKPGLAALTFVLCGCIFTDVREKKIGTANLPVPPTPQQVMGGICQTCDKHYPELPVVPGTSNTGQCPQCGGEVQLQPNEVMKPTIDPLTGQPATMPIDLVDATCDIGLPLYALPRPGATGLHDTDYLGWAQRRSLDSLYFRYDQYEASSDSEQLDGYSIGYEHALNYFYQGVSQTTKSVKDSAMAIEFFVPPGKVKDFPDGFYAVGVGAGPTVFRTEEPWPFLDHPKTFAVYQKIPTLFFGRSVAFELAGVQKEYQAYESLIKLHAMTSAVEPIIIDENTIVTAVTGRSDKVIKWRSIGPGSKEPHRMTAGKLDEGIYRQRESLKNEFENISGAVSVTKGQQPGTITAASAIDKLQGQAEQMYNKPVQNWNSLWKETIRKGVHIRQKKWTPAQIAQVVGPDKWTHIQNFLNCDLDKTIDWMSTAHGLPRSRKERQDELIMLFDRGALDVTDPSVRERIYELFGDTGMMQQFNLDATRARVENLSMKSGKPVQLMVEVEDLGIHLTLHKNEAKKLEFDDWPPASKQLLLEHIMQTQIAMEGLLVKGAAVRGEGAGGGSDASEGGPGKPSGSEASGKPGAPQGPPSPSRSAGQPSPPAGGSNA